MESRTNDITTANKPMTPREFVRTWNMLLTTTKKNVKNGEQLPKVILTMDITDGLRKSLDFVIGRINSDKEFQQEVFMTAGVPVMLQTMVYNDSIQILANNK